MNRDANPFEPPKTKSQKAYDSRLYRWLALCSVTAGTAYTIWVWFQLVETPERGTDVLLWITAPFLLLLLLWLSRLAKEQTAVFFFVCTAVALTSILVYRDLFESEHSTSVLVLLFLPAYQLAGELAWFGLGLIVQKHMKTEE